VARQQTRSPTPRDLDCSPVTSLNLHPQTPHRKLDLSVGQLPPTLNNRRILKQRRTASLRGLGHANAPKGCYAEMGAAVGMAFRGKEKNGTSGWFKARKREVLSHVRALDDFTNVHALATRLVENVGEEIDDTEQLRGALFMTAVVTYARQFMKTKNKYGEASVYQTWHLKSDARFDVKIHDHLIYVRNKLIAHDDGRQLPPTFHVLSLGVDQDPSAGKKPLLATARSYSLSSATGPKFFISLQRHLEGCVEGARRALHEGILQYLTEAQKYPHAHEASIEKRIELKDIDPLRFEETGPVSKKLIGLDQLTERTISVPEGNVHNKAYTYRMLTYTASLPSVTFDVAGDDVEFYSADKPKPLPSKPKHRWRVFSWLRKIVDWGHEPF
jgi:hypothetical protein